MRDWNTEEVYLPSLNDWISGTYQPGVGQLIDESKWLGLLMGAEAETRTTRWFRSANNRARSITERWKPQA
jgi:hypothetical protein